MSTDPPQQRYQGVQKNSIAYRLMKSMGWNEGEGLGASKQGIKEHIRVKKKFENWGVGAVEAAEKARDWSTGMLEFHRVLSTLSEVTSHHAGKDSIEDGPDGNDEKSDASDGELHRNDKDSKKKEGKEQKKKKNRKSDTKSKTGADDKDKEKKKKRKKENECDADATGAGPQRVRQATHLGRFKKRESAKMVKHYSSQDLAAILGGDPFAQAAVAAVENTVRQNDSNDGSENDKKKDKRKKDEKSKKESQDNKENPTKKKVSIQEKNPLQEERQEGRKEEDRQHDKNVEEASASSLWWSGYFIKAGRMGSLKKNAADKKCVGFSEQDQTNLYNLAHDKAIQGKVGLGRSSIPKKVEGARWEGKKIKLGSDSEGEEEGGEEEEVGEDVEDQGVVVVMPKATVQKAIDDRDNIFKDINWKKLMTEILKAKGVDSMKIKSLSKAVMEAHGLEKQHKGLVMMKLEEVCVASSSSMFQLVDGTVVYSKKKNN